ncbi:ATP-binding protein [Caulobacter sp. ErkDOM-E]|uniref:ATP-binding protein n=1 Tax=Caulobacter sp. ErkDOM-E TaxID=3402778 RepID=UPI003AF74623
MPITSTSRPAEAALIQAYVPIARGYLIAAAVYYCLISLSHPFYETPSNLLILGSLSVTAAAYAFVAWRALGRGHWTGWRLEALILVMNGLFLANVIAHHTLHLEPQKLVYFVLMALVFAASAPTRRVALISVALAMTGLFLMARKAPGDMIAQYMFMGMAGAFAALGMSTMVRGAVSREVHARLASDALNADLQRELKENRRLQARAEALAIAAQTANRAKTDFLATMSHEIRTPLNGVLGMAQIMETGALDPEQRHRLGMITTSGQSLLGVINAILDISRIEAGRMEIIPAPFELDFMLDALRQLYGGLAREKGLAFSLDIAPTATGWRLGDAERLRQVLSNLISNAIKFTDRGHVRVTVEGDAHMVTFCIEDTGVGIPESHRGLVFGKFAQLDSSSTRRAGGAGLGLAICKELVGLMGGRIDFASLPGGGTRFRFSTPMPEVQAAASAPATLPAAAYDDETPPRILVVDDNDTNRTVLLTLLGHLGVHGEVARDGREAVAMWELEPWDAILMDIHMPGMDGIEASRTIRERERLTGRPRTPIFAVTASVLAHEQTLYADAGMDGLIPKPIEVAKLVETVTRIFTPPAPEEDRASA